MNKFLVLVFLIISFQSSVFAQEKEKDITVPDTIRGKVIEKKKDVTAPETPKEKVLEKKLSKRLYSFSQFAHETVLYVNQSTNCGVRDWLNLSIVIAGTIAVMPFDERITNSTQGHQRYY